MIAPKGFYVIYQPKYRVPSVLDLNERGLFNVRPFVIDSWAYRLIADEALRVKLQYLCLVEKNTTDPETGRRYNFAVENRLIDLDETLALTAADLTAAVPEETIREKILTGLEEFKSAYIPLGEDKKINKEALRKKLSASIAERREMVCQELVRKNSAWVSSAMPRLIQDFRRTFYFKIGDHLYEHYHQQGGRIKEDELIRKINLFNRVYESDGRDVMRKPDGGIWKDEDEVWACWVGFAGGEEEAKRICRTMNAVFRPLADSMGDEAAANH